MGNKIKNIEHALMAIYQRENIGSMTNSIREKAAVLSAPLTGTSYGAEEWRAWLILYATWRSEVSRWVGEARWYVLRVRSIEAVSESLYDDHTWTIRDNQFPNADAVRKFKTFYIIFSRWDDTVEEVESNLRRAAFTGNALQVLEMAKG